jgi:cobalamin biosynthesis protein CobW
MAAKIPVTVITGFLGSGKTTLIRQQLQNNQGRRIAVLVNEFGEIGIDGDLLRDCQVCDEEGATAPALPSNIVELTNGCLCCTVQEEFLPTMQELLKRRDQIDCILIETSGLALPKPLVQAFRWQEIRTGATVDAVITVVDCEAVATGALAADLGALNEQRQADPNLDHETPLEELFEDQLGCADLVLLTKTDRVDLQTQTHVKKRVQQELRSGIKIIPCQDGQISADILLGFNAAVEDDLDARPSHHDTEEEHEHDDDIGSVPVVIAPAIDPVRLLQTLKHLMEDQEIYRIKGFVNVMNKPMRMVLQGVGDRIETFYDRPWRSNELRETRLIIIGQSLNQSQILSAMQSLVSVAL